MNDDVLMLDNDEPTPAHSKPLATGNSLYGEASRELKQGRASAMSFSDRMPAPKTKASGGDDMLTLSLDDDDVPPAPPAVALAAKKGLAAPPPPAAHRDSTLLLFDDDDDDVKPPIGGRDAGQAKAAAAAAQRDDMLTLSLDDDEPPAALPAAVKPRAGGIDDHDDVLTLFKNGSLNRPSAAATAAAAAATATSHQHHHHQQQSLGSSHTDRRDNDDVLQSSSVSSSSAASYSTIEELPPSQAAVAGFSERSEGAKAGQGGGALQGMGAASMALDADDDGDDGGPKASTPPTPPVKPLAAASALKPLLAPLASDPAGLQAAGLPAQPSGKVGGLPPFGALAQASASHLSVDMEDSAPATRLSALTPESSVATAVAPNGLEPSAASRLHAEPSGQSLGSEASRAAPAAAGQPSEYDDDFEDDFEEESMEDEEAGVSSRNGTPPDKPPAASATATTDKKGTEISPWLVAESSAVGLGAGLGPSGAAAAAGPAKAAAAKAPVAVVRAAADAKPAGSALQMLRSAAAAKPPPPAKVLPLIEAKAGRQQDSTHTDQARKPPPLAKEPSAPAPKKLPPVQPFTQSPVIPHPTHVPRNDQPPPKRAAQPPAPSPYAAQAPRQAPQKAVPRPVPPPPPMHHPDVASHPASSPHAPPPQRPAAQIASPQRNGQPSPQRIPPRSSPAERPAASVASHDAARSPERRRLPPPPPLPPRDMDDVPTKSGSWPQATAPITASEYEKRRRMGWTAYKKAKDEERKQAEALRIAAILEARKADIEATQLKRRAAALERLERMQEHKAWMAEERHRIEASAHETRVKYHAGKPLYEKLQEEYKARVEREEEEKKRHYAEEARDKHLRPGQIISGQVHLTPHKSPGRERPEPSTSLPPHLSRLAAAEDGAEVHPVQAGRWAEARHSDLLPPPPPPPPLPSHYTRSAAPVLHEDTRQAKPAYKDKPRTKVIPLPSTNPKSRPAQLVERGCSPFVYGSDGAPLVPPSQPVVRHDEDVEDAVSEEAASEEDDHVQLGESGAGQDAGLREQQAHGDDEEAVESEAEEPPPPPQDAVEEPLAEGTDDIVDDQQSVSLDHVDVEASHQMSEAAPAEDDDEDYTAATAQGDSVGGGGGTFLTAGDPMEEVPRFRGHAPPPEHSDDEDGGVLRL